MSLEADSRRKLTCQLELSARATFVWQRDHHRTWVRERCEIGVDAKVVRGQLPCLDQVLIDRDSNHKASHRSGLHSFSKRAGLWKPTSFATEARPATAPAVPRRKMSLNKSKTRFVAKLLARRPRPAMEGQKCLEGPRTGAVCRLVDSVTLPAHS